MKIILRLGDGTTEETALIETDLSQEQLQKIIDKIKNEYYKKGFEDWCYDDLLEELEKRKHITTLQCNGTYDIYA